MTKSNVIETLKNGKEVLVSSASEIKAKFADGEMYLGYEGEGWTKVDLTLEDIAGMVAR